MMSPSPTPTLNSDTRYSTPTSLTSFATTDDPRQPDVAISKLDTRVSKLWVPQIS
ncbi:hypothetical protein BDW66DRAFT_140374 [Aspergillus desertorum]